MVQDQQHPIETVEPDLAGERWVERGLQCAVVEREVWELEAQLPEERVQLDEGRVLVQEPLAQWL